MVVDIILQCEAFYTITLPKCQSNQVWELLLRPDIISLHTGNADQCFCFPSTTSKTTECIFCCLHLFEYYYCLHTCEYYLEFKFSILES